MPKHKVIPVTEEEVRALLNAALPSRRDYLALRLMCKTGMRIGELARVNVRDIDFKLNVIFIPKAKKDKINPGERREVPFDVLTGQLLRSFINDYEIKGPLWWGSKAKPIHYRGLRDLPGNYRKLAGIGKPISCHSLRHFFGTHLIRHGVDPFTVKTLMGHKSLNTTDLYTHIATTEALGDYNEVMGKW